MGLSGYLLKIWHGALAFFFLLPLKILAYPCNISKSLAMKLEVDRKTYCCDSYCLGVISNRLTSSWPWRMMDLAKGDTGSDIIGQMLLILVILFAKIDAKFLLAISQILCLLCLPMT